MKFIKWFIKNIKKEDRTLRLVFLGKRLKIRQLNWLFYSNHPQELERK